MKTNWLKYALGIAGCFFLRLAPFRPPNMEPLLATAMPFAKQYGYLPGFFFGVLSIGLFDLATGTLGPWTLVTAAAYGLVGLGAAAFLRRRRSSPWNYAAYAAAGTIAYDALTGLTIGPIMFGQPFREALAGQIPFTLMHLGGNVVLAAVISPLVYRWVVMNRRLEILTTPAGGAWQPDAGDIL